MSEIENLVIENGEITTAGKQEKEGGRMIQKYDL